MNKAKYITEITVTDPDTNAPVALSIFKDGVTGGMFAIDSSYLEQNFEDDEKVLVHNVFLSDFNRFSDKDSILLVW